MKNKGLSKDVLSALIERVLIQKCYDVLAVLVGCDCESKIVGTGLSTSHAEPINPKDGVLNERLWFKK